MLVQLTVVLLVALIGAFAVSFGFRHAPRRWSFWTLLIVLFALGLGVSLWARPVGPLVYGFAWLPVVMGTLVVVFLMLAVGWTPAPESRGASPEQVGGAARVFLWFLMASLAVLLVAGMM